MAKIEFNMDKFLKSFKKVKGGGHTINEFRFLVINWYALLENPEEFLDEYEFLMELIEGMQTK